MWFTRVSIQNPVFAAMLMLALLVLGLFSYQRLQVEEFPDIKFPIIVVNTAYPGASSEVVESDVSRKIEDALASVSGLKNLYSYSYQGRSVVVAEFELSTNPDVAAQDVREKVASAKVAFRDEVGEPLISRFNPDDRPIISVAMTSQRLDLRALTTRAEEYLRKQYQTLKGVGQVNIVGGVRREVQIQLIPERMRSLHVGADQVMNALQRENQELPAGSMVLDQREQQVQINGRFISPSAFGKIVVAKHGTTPILLEQVAQVIDGAQEQETISRMNGQPSLTLDVIKIQGANTIEVADLVRKRTEELKQSLAREGVQLNLLSDASKSVRNALSNVRESLIEGAVLTILIVFLFLGSWRSTVITGLTLPLALLGTFWFIYIAGFSINVMTLMALSLCVGLLIDDAIVVRENIVRHAAMGKSAHDAAVDGTREIGLAVLATTLSIVAVFLPVGFMGGIIGKFFFAFGLTVTAAVLISMFVSFTLDPMLSSIWPDPDTHVQTRRGPLAGILNGFERFLEWLSAQYAHVIAWSLRRRKTVILIAFLSLVGALMLLKVVGAEFAPQPDMSRLQVRFDTNEGASLDYTTSKLVQVEAAMREFPEVLETYSSVNVGGSLGKNAANIDLLLKPRHERSLSTKELTPKLRERIQRIGGITLKGILVPGGPGGGQKPIYLSIQGGDFRVLQQIANQVTSQIEKIPGIVDLESSFKDAKPTWMVDLDRDLAARAGFSLASVGNAIHPLIAGDAVTAWLSPEGETYDVRIRLPSDMRNSRADLEQLPLASNQVDGSGLPVMVPLVQIANVRDSSTPAQINRRSLFREIALTANLDKRPLGEVSAQIQKIITQVKLPPGYRFDLGGSAKDMAESAGYAGSALLLAVIFIYMVLASQFGSLLQPFAIMSSLPLSLIGVMLALLITGNTLNVFSIIGVIMLMGLVTKNAILLIDFVNHQRAQGVERSAAIIEAGKVRLRPILMTTCAMVFGMLPLAFAVAEGSEQRSPMAHAIIGGVLTSTLLTLIVVPVTFTYLDDWGSRFKKKT